MKLTILQQDLLPILQSVSRSCGIKATLPVLANVLIQAENNTLKLSATNLEIGVIKEVSAKISEEGSVTIPAKTFLDLISALSGAEIELEATNDQLKITTKQFNATLNGIASAEFPSIPFEATTFTKLKVSDISQAVPEVTFAAASDEGRPILTGILTQVRKNSLELVATDGFRLAHKVMEVQGSDPLSVLIPKRTFEEITRLMNEEKNVEDFELAISENHNQIIFKVGQTNLSSRLIEGQFPAWEKIIPTNFECKATVDKQELVKAVKIAAVFARDTANIVKIETVGDKSLKLSSEAKELGNQETQIEAQINGTPLSIAFNSKFLLDSLMATSTDQVILQFSGSLSPTLIKPVGTEGLEFVVMPVRLS